MAKAVISKKMLDRSGVDKVVLYLSMDEASALKRVLGRVGGSRIHTRRKFISEIWEKLDLLDISSGEYLDTEGRIDFIPTPETDNRKVS